MIRERGMPSMSLAQQSVLVGLVSGAVTGIATIAIVETSEPGSRRDMQRERYAALAGSAIAGGLVGALVLALNADSDGLRGNVG